MITVLRLILNFQWNNFAGERSEHGEQNNMKKITYKITLYDDKETKYRLKICGDVLKVIYDHSKNKDFASDEDHDSFHNDIELGDSVKFSVKCSNGKEASFTTTLFNDTSTIEKLDFMDKFEAMFDDERNNMPDEYINLIDSISIGDTLTVTNEIFKSKDGDVK
ncbi:hypothetical protein N9043_00195 [bacterium]|nr:hypothetical protein [bacterium]